MAEEKFRQEVMNSIAEQVRLVQSMKEVIRIIDDIHGAIDKKEYLSYVKSCYKRDDEKGLIKLTVDIQENGVVMLNRVYSNLEDLKEINDDNARRILNILSTFVHKSLYDRNSEYMLLIILKYCSITVFMDIRKFKTKI